MKLNKVSIINMSLNIIWLSGHLDRCCTTDTPCRSFLCVLSKSTVVFRKTSEKVTTKCVPHSWSCHAECSDTTEKDGHVIDDVLWSATIWPSSVGLTLLHVFRCVDRQSSVSEEKQFRGTSNPNVQHPLKSITKIIHKIQDSIL